MIRSFTPAAAAAPVPVAPAPALPGNTGNKNTKGRTIFRGPRGGEYVLNGTRKIRSFTRATAAAPTAAPTAALAKKLAKFLKLSNTEYIDKNGNLYNNQARIKYDVVSAQRYNTAATQAFNKDPKFLKKSAIPYVGHNRPNEALKKKHRLKNSSVMRVGKTLSGSNTGVRKKIYFNKHGFLYFLTLNGRKNSVTLAPNAYRIEGGSRNMRQTKRLIGMSLANYPRNAIPPATPEARRSSPALLANMMNQIYIGGRAGNVNAGRYTKAERNVLARRLGGSIAYFKQQRDTKKEEAARQREFLRYAGLTNAQKQAYRNRAAAANERVGYFDDAVRAYTRGLRAVKPLTGAVTPRARAMPNTPNRYTPAPANVNVNAIYMPLNKPHLVVKTPGAGTIYLNPNTFTGFMKNAGRVIIAPANVRNWLRMARRNFPNEALFRHPLAAKNVTASQIRFSK